MKRFLGVFLLFVFASADAALIDRGGGFIYDDVLDITWTQDANINGQDNWDNQVAWAAGLSIVDTRPGAGGVTYSDWRLPSVDVNGDDINVSCTVDQTACMDNEYGHLFSYGGGTVFGGGITSSNPGPFSNIQANLAYWSSTEAPIDPSGGAFQFSFFNGGSPSASNKVNNRWAWAVRPGDVNVVPVPAAVWLFGSALLGLLGLRRMRR